MGSQLWSRASPARGAERAGTFAGAGPAEAGRPDPWVAGPGVPPGSAASFGQFG